MTLCKRLTSLGNRGAMAMAVMLLLPLASSCLVPQDDQVFPALPPRKNNPPRIVRASPDQRVTTILVGPVSTSCPSPQFSVTVNDDVGETISSKWFVDATADFKPTIASPEFVPSPVDVTGTNFGVAAVSSPKSLINKLSQLIDNKQHRVDVWVTDGKFGSDSIDVTLVRGQTLPDGTTSVDCSNLVDGKSPPYCDLAYKDNYVWLVEVQTCP